ncbi:MAG: NYN domain-containing protein [Patescibacteria group bacterium]
MIKIMIFIDGTWLYSNIPSLRETYGQEDFHIDFGKLPIVLTREVSRLAGAEEVDLVRTHLFGSYASNYDLRDDEAVQRRRDFFLMLKEEYHYELELYAINYMGRRLRKADRDPEDAFEAKEKCVDISLAATMLYAAALPHVYDVAIVVTGDGDFVPVLQRVRLLGKRVAIASIRSSCASDLSDPHDPSRVKDFDTIWIDDLLKELELTFEPHQLRCESPIHKGKREVWTTFYPRKGQRFYCDTCRTEFLEQKQMAQEEYVSDRITQAEEDERFEEVYTPPTLTGELRKKVPERGFGFIKAGDGNDYFFHFTDCTNGTHFEDLEEGALLDFEVKKEPSFGKAGAAQNVRSHRSG